MTIAIILSGPRASGKTTLARQLAGENPHIVPGTGLADDTSMLRHATAERHWIMDGGGMNVLDIERLHGFVEAGCYPVELANGTIEQRPMPRFVIVDGFNL